MPWQAMQITRRPVFPHGCPHQQGVQGADIHEQQSISTGKVFAISRQTAVPSIHMSSRRKQHIAGLGALLWHSEAYQNKQTKTNGESRTPLVHDPQQAEALVMLRVIVWDDAHLRGRNTTDVRHDLRHTDHAVVHQETHGRPSCCESSSEMTSICAADFLELLHAHGHASQTLGVVSDG